MGVLHVAASESSVAALDELMNVASAFNEPAEYLSHETVQNKAPWLKTDEVLKFGFMPGESYCDPYLLGNFFLRDAQKNARRGYSSGN